MSERKRILFTGGGSSGHVAPNLALIEKFQEKGWEISYVGSYQGIEKRLIAPTGISYYAITSGKLRRYFSWQNFIDPFKILFGILQAVFLCLRIKPNVVFSKGGFVAFPVVVAAWLCRIPIIAHESDLTPGLANKLSYPFAKKICVTFEETRKQLPKTEKVVVTGTPLRKQLFAGNKEKGRALCGFSGEKPVVMILGGGLGATPINEAIQKNLSLLLENFNIAHLCGYGKLNESLNNVEGYKQFEYLSAELPDLFALSDVVVSRAGANSLCELIALRKPHLLIPLPKGSSRGDQIANAECFYKKGISDVLYQKDLTCELLLRAINKLYEERDERKNTIENYPLHDSIKAIYDLIINNSKSRRTNR